MAAPKFNVGDLVFARIKGFPVWPARIAHYDVFKRGVQYQVFFFGTYERGVVNEKFIYPFDENEATMGKPRSRGNFNQSMAEARETRDLSVEEVVQRFRSPELQLPPTYPSPPPPPAPKKAKRQQKPAVESNNAEKGGIQSEISGHDVLVKASCGEWVKLHFKFDPEKEASAVITERIAVLQQAIENGNYLPSTLKRRLEERREEFKDNSKRPRLSKSLFSPEKVVNYEAEFLMTEKYLVETALELKRLVTLYKRVSKNRGNDETSQQKEERHKKKEATKETMKKLLKDAAASHHLKRAAPLILLKNPIILEVLRDLKDGSCGDTIADASMPFYERLALIFGLKEGQAFLTAYILRKRTFDHAINTLPKEQRQLLTFDPTCDRCTVAMEEGGPDFPVCYSGSFEHSN